MKAAAIATCLLLSACVAVVPIPVPRSAPQPAVSNEPAPPARAFTALINNFRASQGVGPLRQSAALARAAQAHAEDMETRGYFSHRSEGGPNGASLLARARAAGCQPRAIAENIARGQKTEEEVLNGWAGSPGHRSNMLNTRMTEYGIGEAGEIWVLNLSAGC